MAWLLLLLAAVFEVVWPIAFKQADGLSRPVPALIGGAAAAASLLLLALALRSLPVGTAYVAWVGLGAVGVALAGIAFFGEPATAARVGFLALIVIGLVGLQLSSTGD